MLVIGTGGFAVDLLTDLQTQFKKNEILFFNDTEIPPPAYLRNNFEILADAESAKKYFGKGDSRFLTAIGHNSERERITAKFLALGGTNPSFISKPTFIGDASGISGNGVIVMHDATISWGDVIEEGSVIYVGSRLGHDSIIGRYAFVGANTVMSKTTLGDYCYVGIGVKFKPGNTLGANCVVGVGSVVTKSFPANSIIKGIPAKTGRE